MLREKNILIENLYLIIMLKNKMLHLQSKAILPKHNPYNQVSLNLRQKSGD
jgi:hypothetical protein